MDDKEIRRLIEAATEAKENAYAPYSNFRVGAAALGESGKIYTGCNVENASYGLTVCAERVAIFSAACAGERRILALAVITDLEEIADCCGACRQVMVEFSNPDKPMAVINAAKDGRYQVFSLDQLIPHPFRMA